MVKVTPAGDSRVSDLGISLLSFAIALLGVSFSKAVIRKAGQETENNFAEAGVQFVCPNEFTQQETSKKKNILFIWQTRDTPSVWPAPNAKRELARFYVGQPVLVRVQGF
ncbi:MAG: hypothetical protein DME26_08860 [Verrucomicrobia bacterium]|nr:MAG: hypothetical protein DME26_08860 [Verrucomicrobiota bacterium]